MSRLNAINPDSAEGKAKELMDGVKQKLGMVPNFFRTMANAPAVLQAYLGFSGALKEGVLPDGLREQIALAVSEMNGCEYCVAAHTAIGKMVGLSEEELINSRRGTGSDAKVDAVLKFSRQAVEKRGWVSDEDVSALRNAGYGDTEIVEIVANIALNLFTNTFNHVAGTEVDFPKAPELSG
jgi:uncharacterized peroxidase-related enzyme